MTNFPDKTRDLAALLVGCRAEEILSLRTTAEGGLIVIAPSGQKFTFSVSQVEEARTTGGLITAETQPSRSAGRKRART